MRVALHRYCKKVSALVGSSPSLSKGLRYSLSTSRRSESGYVFNFLGIDWSFPASIDVSVPTLTLEMFRQFSLSLDMVMPRYHPETFLVSSRLYDEMRRVFMEEEA